MSDPVINCAHDALVPVCDLKPNPENPNKHDAAQLALYAKILFHQGWRKSVTVSNQSGFIVTGHGAWLTAKAQGWPTVPVDYQDFASKADEVAHMIADNKLAQQAELDDVELAKLIRAELNGKCDLDLSGLDLEGLREIGAIEPEPIVDAPAQIDRAEELRKKWGVERGQLWELGEHRILCGDSTSRADVDGMTAGQQASMVFTDPPYNVAYQDNESAESLKARHRRSDGLVVANDAMTDDEFDKFLRGAFVAWPLKEGGAFYVCAPPGRTETQFRNSLDSVKALSLRQCLVWAKDVFVFGRQDYHWRHESILYGWKLGAAHFFVEDRTQDTVWSIPRPAVSELHPTTKPIKIPLKAIGNSSRLGELIFDGFSGSGTTLIACEQLGRRCRAIEIDPAYVAVSLQRWADATGKTPRLAVNAL